MASKSDIIPFDPSGSVLFQMDDPEKWVTYSENKPEHFGKYGIDTFLFSHHQNCENMCFSTWDEYNVMLDIKNTNGLKRNL